MDDLPQNVKEIARRANVTTPEQVIITSRLKWLSVKGCTELDIKILKEAAAKIVGQRVVPVSALLKSPTKWSRISFGCASLDRCTRGGVVTRGITEICGVSGGGKTQILLQLSLAVQLPRELGGLGKGVAFICTKGKFPSKRIFEMAKTFSALYPEQKINYLGNIYIEHAIESDDLLKCVGVRLKKLMETISIGLIIVDSVAAVFRVYSNYLKRARDMRKLANFLLSYGDKYNCAVVCVNQVTTAVDKNRELPSLGLAWAHLGRTRIKISKVPKQVIVDNKLVTVRKLEIMYSPESPNEFAEFIITGRGVVDVPKLPW